jgi:hypothetical protein
VPKKAKEGVREEGRRGEGRRKKEEGRLTTPCFRRLDRCLLSFDSGLLQIVHCQVTEGKCWTKRTADQVDCNIAYCMIDRKLSN